MSSLTHQRDEMNGKRGRPRSFFSIVPEFHVSIVVDCVLQGDIEVSLVECHFDVLV